MYASTPSRPASAGQHASAGRTAGPAGDGRDNSLRVSRASRRVFDGDSPAALDPMLGVYLSDMLRPYGLEPHAGLLARGSGHSYGEMAGALLPEAVPADEPVDLLVFAFACPDVVPGRSTASYLSYLCPGSPMAFAVCDQGAAAPFTGLRLAGEYLHAGACERILLVTAEQSALHYDRAGPAPLPARNAAVTLLCGRTGPGRVAAVRQHANLAPAQAAGQLAADLAAMDGGRRDVTLIAGNGLAGAGALPAVAEVLLAPAGQPCTGVWWELAGGLGDWSAQGRRVLLADYDPVLGYLCTVAIDAAASWPAGRRAPASQRAPAAQPGRAR